MKPLILCAAAALLAGSALAGTLQVSLANSLLSGKPGATVEWFANLSDPVDLAVGDSILITGSSFDVPCQGCAPPPPALGVYTDLIGAGFVVLAPAGNCCGDPQTISGIPIGTFAISPTAPFGPIHGFLQIDYAIFSDDPNDPNFDPNTETVAPDVQSFPAATVVSVPEPNYFLLAFIGLFIAWRTQTGVRHSAIYIPSHNFEVNGNTRSDSFCTDPSLPTR